MLFLCNCRRSAYTAIEDRALIRYVRKHGKSHGELSTKGNALYKKMEKEKVSSFEISYVQAMIIKQVFLSHMHLDEPWSFWALLV